MTMTATQLKEITESGKMEGFPSRRIRRLCFYGGPGCGKSTLTAHSFYLLKRAGVEVEIAREYVKRWAYRNDTKLSHWDQIYFMGKQFHEESWILDTGNLDAVICESPLLLSAFYTQEFFNTSPDLDPSSSYPTGVIDLIRSFDVQYPPIHVFLRRGNKPYKKVGRFQTESEAREIDERLYDFVDRGRRWCDPLIQLDYHDNEMLTWLLMRTFVDPYTKNQQPKKPIAGDPVEMG